MNMCLVMECHGMMEWLGMRCNDMGFRHILVASYFVLQTQGDIFFAKRDLPLQIQAARGVSRKLEELIHRAMMIFRISESWRSRGC